jgi:RNA recognition motif-containing protein
MYGNLTCHIFAAQFLLLHMKLFVAGLPFDVDDQELHDIFSEQGTVASAKIITDRDTGKSRGFGFVEFPDDAQAQAAIKAYDGAELSGRTITVKVAEDKPRNNDSRQFGRSKGFSQRENSRNRY